MTTPPDAREPDDSPGPSEDQAKTEARKYYGMTKHAHIITGVVFAVVFLCCIGAVQGWFGESEPESPPLSEQAENVCYSAVLDSLKAPSSAELVEVSAYPSEGDQWIVNGAVDAENSFGAMLRSDFSCTVHQSGDGWSIDSIDVD